MAWVLGMVTFLTDETTLPKITRRMAIANGTCVSFCNHPKAQCGYLRRVTPVCRYLHPFCRWRHLATSKRYASGTIAVKVTWMKRGFNDCQTHRSMYPSIFNRFPVIQPVSSKVCHFSTFFASPGYAPGTIAVNIPIYRPIQSF